MELKLWNKYSVELKINPQNLSAKRSITRMNSVFAGIK